MLPFGPFHPDKAGINVEACTSAVNCVPGVNGYRPLKAPEAATGLLGIDYLTDDAGNFITDDAGSYIATDAAPADVTCLGAAVMFDDDGDVFTFSGDEASLYKLDASNVWLDISRTSGGNYSVGGSERWQFGFSGGLVIAVTIGDEPQKYLLGTSSHFEALGGTPPKARFITALGEFIVLGGLFGDERTVHWSGLANPEHWTPGAQSCDTQTFQNGGPVRGLVGGEVAYVFQAEIIRRMTYVPGSETIMQFDEVEGARGLAAPYSLVKVGNQAFYRAADGFYKFTLVGGASTPIGVGKWVDWFTADLKPGSEQTIIGGVDPIGKHILWAYNSVDSVDVGRNRVLIYDWALDEATTADLDVTAITQMLTQGVTLDTMDSYGDLDSLPYSLDSPIWRGGAPLLGLFLDGDPRMSFLTGSNLEAQFVTTDGEKDGRTLIKGVRPHIDTRSVQISVSAREAEGDSVVWNDYEDMADTGVVPAWVSGFVARARMTVAEGATWSKFTGISSVVGGAGKR